jgi:sterol desaturase/sphingolipid hydroxylase (fatty acid hydroxylase superfamily)
VHDFLLTAWHAGRHYAWRILLAGIVCTTLELAFSRGSGTLSSRLRGAGYWMFYIAITATFFAWFGSAWGKLGITPLFVWHVGALSYADQKWLHVVSWFAAPVFGSMVGEFFYYWFHRAQHTFPFMWRFHEVHHSIEEMNGFNNNHHFTEEIFRIPFITLPMSFLIAVDQGLVPIILGTFIGMQGQYEHSTTRLHLGPLKYLVADNRYHRLHHSLNPADWGHNFGSFTPVWDILFRTARFPAHNYWPETGVPGVREPKTLRDFLFMPFRRHQPRQIKLGANIAETDKTRAEAA